MGTNKKNQPNEFNVKYKQCPICTKSDMTGFYEDWLSHMSLTHKHFVTRMSDLFWLGNEEAYYKGKHYKRGK